MMHGACRYASYPLGDENSSTSINETSFTTTRVLCAFKSMFIRNSVLHLGSSKSDGHSDLVSSLVRSEVKRLLCHRRCVSFER